MTGAALASACDAENGGPTSDPHPPSLEPCFEVTYRWAQLADDLVSGDVERVRAAVLRLEERDREIEQKICTVGSLPHSDCCLVYNGPVDSYSIDTTVDAQAAGWTAGLVVAHARIWVQNNTGGSGLVELVGAFTIAGSDQTGSSSLLRLTIPDGEGLLLADHCTISSASNIGYRVTNIGATNVDVTVNVTVTEVDAAQACCTGGE